jgi:hypothetical protein
MPSIVAKVSAFVILANQHRRLPIQHQPMHVMYGVVQIASGVIVSKFAIIYIAIYAYYSRAKALFDS